MWVFRHMSRHWFVSLVRWHVAGSEHRLYRQVSLMVLTKHNISYSLELPPVPRPLQLNASLSEFYISYVRFVLVLQLGVYNTSLTQCNSSHFKY